MILKYEQTLFCYNDEEETTEIFYEPSDDELKDALYTIVSQEYGFDKEMTKKFIEDTDLVYEIAEKFYEDLKAYFYNEAMEQYE